MKQIDLREGARRQHRAVALYAVIQCWMRGLDGVAFQRKDLERLLGLVRFKATRVDWLKQDLREYFPFIEEYYRTGHTDSLSSIFVARVPLAKALPKGTMTTAARVARIKKFGPRMGVFEMWDTPTTQVRTSFEALVPFFADRVNFDERLLAAYLALLAQGQISPTRLTSAVGAKVVPFQRAG